MNGRIGSGALAVTIFLGVLAQACAHAAVLRVDDTRRIVSLGEPAFSPDGHRIAFIVTRSDAARGTYPRELWIVNADGTQLSRLIAGSDVAVPRWSPDGKTLTYLARGAGGHLQVARYEGGGKSAFLTHAANDVNDFAWKPGGTAIAFTAYDAASTRDYFEPANTDYTQTSLTPPVHLWLMNSDGRHPRRLTHGSWTIAPTDAGGIFTSQFAWSADGRSIYYTRVATTSSGDDEQSRIERLDLAGGRTVHLTSHDRTELTPQPFGKQIAYWYPQDGDFLAQNQLHVLADGIDTIVSQSLDRNIGGSLWMRDGKSFIACGTDRARGAAWRIGTNGSVSELTLGGLAVECEPYSDGTFDAGISADVSSTGSLAFIATDATHEDELYVAATPGASPHRLTHFNDWLLKRTLGKTVRFSWNGPQGQLEYGIITYPPSMHPGVRYPIAIAIHGGPGEANVDALTAWPRAQLFAAHGYIVFQPNYRGSDDNGNAYMTSIEGDTVVGPAEDILTGLNAVKMLPNADPARVAVGGWSYGGLLTSWLVTQYHDFRAAISGAAVNDEIEEYDLSVSNVQDRYYLKASPYDPGGQAIYLDQSPLTFAARVTTPTLIWSTTGDAVVPTTMSYSFYRALLERHVPVKFVEFVGSTHGPSTPAQTEEITAIWIQWMDRYLR